MPPTEEQVKYRATELQDILSSFDPSLLPIEYEESTFKNIIGKRPSTPRRRQTEWTITGNLPGTLLQWGAYNEQGWQFLSQIQSPTFRAIAFSQKINRRFDMCFEEYDALGALTSATVIRERVNHIAESLDFLSNAIYEDRQSRQLGETDTLGVALRAIASLCKRTRPFVIATNVPAETARRPTRRNPSQGEAQSENVPSLFAVVLRKNDSSPGTPSFLLKALECVSGASLQSCLTQLISINGLLDQHKADEEYIRRFEALQQKAREETGKASEILEEPSGSGSGRGGNGGRGSSGRSHGLEADPRPGSKRPPHPPSDTTSKRGRTTGTK